MPGFNENVPTVRGGGTENGPRLIPFHSSFIASGSQ